VWHNINNTNNGINNTINNSNTATFKGA